MKKKLAFRAGTLCAAAVLSAGALFMFAGCESNHPEVTITYAFNGRDYAVDYRLSRLDAPVTVRHFLELAEAGYYNGLAVHHYADSRIYTGGYRLNTEENELVEVDYFTTVRQLEQEKKITFTPSVWRDKECTTPTYTIYGEFSTNGVGHEYGRELSAGAGALVMYYTSKGNYDGDVYIRRADGGKENEGVAVQDVRYEYNCATSLFYTFTGESDVNVSNYALFGNAINYTSQLANGLLKAINDYIATWESPEDFTETVHIENVNQYDPIEEVQKGDLDADYKVPMDKPIIVKSVKINRW